MNCSRKNAKNDVDIEHIISRLGCIDTHSVVQMDGLQLLQEKHGVSVRTIGFVCNATGVMAGGPEIIDMFAPHVDIVRGKNKTGALCSAGVRSSDPGHRINARIQKKTKPKKNGAKEAPPPGVMRNTVQMWYTLPHDGDVNIYTQIFLSKTDTVSIQVSGCRSLTHVDRTVAFLQRHLKSEIFGVRLTLCSTQFRLQYNDISTANIYRRLEAKRQEHLEPGSPLRWNTTWRDAHVDANLHFQVLNEDTQKTYKGIIYKSGVCSIQCANFSDLLTIVVNVRSDLLAEP